MRKMTTTINLSSDFLHRARWPLVLVAAAAGLVPHILLLNSDAASRLAMIVFMHAILVPTFTSVALLALEARERNLEQVNVRLRNQAEELSRKSQQNSALTSAVRLLAGAPSVASVMDQLVILARQIAQASRLRIEWIGTDGAPSEHIADGPATGNGDELIERQIPLQEAGARLGNLVATDGRNDDFTIDCLTILSSEIGLRWRLRQTEMRTLNALATHTETLRTDLADRQTSRLLDVLCESVQAAGASLFLHRDGTWYRRAIRGAAPDTPEEELRAAAQCEFLWRGRQLFVRGTPDVLLILHHPASHLSGKPPRNHTMLQILANYIATLLRLSDANTELLWAERRRLGRELHDGVCQTIASLHMQLDHLADLINAGRPTAVERSRELATVALQAYSEIRAAIEGLRQMPNEDESSCEFLERVAKTECDKRGLKLNLATDEVDVSPETAWQLGRVVQEAIANAAHHAGAALVTLKIARTPEGVQIEIFDDGDEHQPVEAEDSVRPGHFGVEIMKERIVAVNGQIRLSVANGRSMVSITLPQSRL